MSRVISTKQFTKCIRDLVKKGKKGKDAMMRARAAQAEAAEQGEITCVPRTNHGESRLPNIEKFNLGDGYRLVVQLVDPSAGQRAFLFVGDHEDAESWLENHKRYRWVKREGDETLDFVQVSEEEDTRSVLPKVDTESPESLLELPLLRDVSDVQWRASKVSASVAEYLKTITAELWEQDPSGIVAHVESISDIATACFASDVLEHAHEREWNELHRRFEIASGTSRVVDGAEAAAAMVATANSEQFVTWEDVADLPVDTDWADWMLFLHPEQKNLATREFNGPARLRGVSGSGKTCVMVHRARHLARKYRQDILLVTLTASTRQLLDSSSNFCAEPKRRTSRRLL